MRRFVYLPLLFSYMLSLQACAHTKNVIVQSSGYFYVPVQGTIPVEENGQPLNHKRDTVFLLFIETRARNIQWEKAWTRGTSFFIDATAIKPANEIIGETKQTHQRVALSAAKGNTLWQLMLSKNAAKEHAPLQTIYEEVLLKGKRNNRVFYHTISSLTELASPLYP